MKGCKGDLDDDDILTISSERRPYVRVETKIEFIKTQKGVHFCKFSVPTLIIYLNSSFMANCSISIVGQIKTNLLINNSQRKGLSVCM